MYGKPFGAYQKDGILSANLLSNVVSNIQHSMLILHNLNMLKQL